MDSKFKLEFPEAIAEFERILKKFNLKKKIFKLLFKGRGLEFEQFRDFDESEDASAIDWPASLRAGKLLAKQYIEEKDIKFYFVLDVSSSMLFGSDKRLKAEYSADIVLSLSRLIMSSQDKVGLLMFNEKVVRYIPPKNSRNHFYQMQEVLSDISLYGGTTDFHVALEFLLGLIKSRNTMVIFISDFFHMDPKVQNTLSVLTRKCEAMALAVRDPLDLELPITNDLLVLGNANSKESMVVDTVLAKNAYKQIVEEQTNTVRAVFKDSDIDLLELLTDTFFVLPIIRFLQERSKGVENGLTI
jgi:uncharacterized protein (DUF58 family)